MASFGLNQEVKKVKGRNEYRLKKLKYIICELQL